MINKLFIARATTNYTHCLILKQILDLKNILQCNHTLVSLISLSSPFLSSLTISLSINA